MSSMISRMNPRYCRIFPSQVPYYVIVLIKCKMEVIG